jgi:hypothetical protein
MNMLGAPKYIVNSGARVRTPRARRAGAASRLDVVADPFCVADLLFEHTYLNFFE